MAFFFFFWKHSCHIWGSDREGWKPATPKESPSFSAAAGEARSLSQKQWVDLELSWETGDSEFVLAKAFLWSHPSLEIDGALALPSVRWELHSVLGPSGRACLPIRAHLKSAPIEWAGDSGARTDLSCPSFFLVATGMLCAFVRCLFSVDSPAPW